MHDYAEIARQSRVKVLELVFKAQTSHIGSLFGAADIMAVLFERLNFDKDKFIAGKSWLAALLYYHLWRRGRITEEELNSFCMPGSKFIGLVEAITPDIPFGIGSMGYGFPAAVGFALSKKLKKEKGTVYCYMSDGELQCGTTWEASLIAAHHKLNNLVVIVEENGFQAMGKVEDILSCDFPAKGWCGIRISGHNYQDLRHFFTPIATLMNGTKVKVQITEDESCPLVIVAKTIKGKGWKRAENNNLYHYKQLSQGEYEEALKELQ